MSFLITWEMNISLGIIYMEEQTLAKLEYLLYVPIWLDSLQKKDKLLDRCNIKKMQLSKSVYECVIMYKENTSTVTNRFFFCQM